MSKIQKRIIVSGLLVATTILGFSGPNLLGSMPAEAQLSSWFRRRPKVILGGRSGICPIAPGLLEKDLTVVSDRPLFTWTGKGKATKLTVRDYNTKEEVWSVNLKPDTQQIAYGGDSPLQPDTVYEWQVLGEKLIDTAQWNMVAVMSKAERNRHLAALKAIEQNSKNQSIEAIVDAKVAYLLDDDRRLWSDALQVLSEVKNPSPEFVQNRKDFFASLCTEAR